MRSSRRNCCRNTRKSMRFLSSMSFIGRWAVWRSIFISHRRPQSKSKVNNRAHLLKPEGVFLLCNLKNRTSLPPSTTISPWARSSREAPRSRKSLTNRCPSFRSSTAGLRRRETCASSPTKPTKLARATPSRIRLHFRKVLWMIKLGRGSRRRRKWALRSSRLPPPPHPIGELRKTSPPKLGYRLPRNWGPHSVTQDCVRRPRTCQQAPTSSETPPNRIRTPPSEASTPLAKPRGNYLKTPARSKARTSLSSGCQWRRRKRSSSLRPSSWRPLKRQTSWRKVSSIKPLQDKSCEISRPSESRESCQWRSSNSNWEKGPLSVQNRSWKMLPPIGHRKIRSRSSAWAPKLRFELSAPTDPTWPMLQHFLEPKGRTEWSIRLRPP